MTTAQTLSDRRAELLALACAAIDTAADSEERRRLNRHIAEHWPCPQMTGESLVSQLLEIDELEDATLQPLREPAHTGAADVDLDARRHRLRSAFRLLRTLTAESYERHRDEQTEKLAAALATVSRLLRHDIKTPLQAASLNLEILLLEHAEMQVDTTVLEMIQSSIEQAVAMLVEHENVP